MKVEGRLERVDIMTHIAEVVADSSRNAINRE
jgi:hypothetical protein